MRLVLFSVIAFFYCTPGRSQDMAVMTHADIRALVNMVDAEIDLSGSQEDRLFEVLKASYDNLKEIQSSDRVDVEKLQLILKNQQNADAQLQKIFTVDQYISYGLLVDGAHDAGGNLDSADPRVVQLAVELGLKGDKRKSFEQILGKLDDRTAQILELGDPETLELDLLVAILASDMEMIDLLGREGYEKFHARREAGALTGNPASGGQTDIGTVLILHDIAREIELSPKQSEDMIRLILEGEIEKKGIREKYKASPAMMEEKLQKHEEGALMRIQSILTAEQFEKILDLLDQ